MPLANWTDAQVLAQLNSGTRWFSNTITFAFATSSYSTYTASGEGSGFSALSSSSQVQARLALALWDDLIVNDMQEVAAGFSYTSTNIEFGMSTTGVDYAHAYFPTTGSVWFSSDFNFGDNSLVAPQIGTHGFLSYVHEIGHALGLDHMGDYNGAGDWTPSSYQDSTVLSVMSYFGPDWGSGAGNGEGLVAWADWVGADGELHTPQTPMLNDVMAIQAIYGAETTTRTGDTVYGFNANVGGTAASIYNFTVNLNPILTIFDSSGQDTLDFSGWNTPSSISLVSGTFSSANSMTSNIAIAYSAVIENAIGGGGNDTIAGNGVANILTGNGGNDVLSGAAGNDTLRGGSGNDAIDGGADTDTVVLGAAWSNFGFSYSLGTFIIGGDTAIGVDTIVNVESFTDSLGVTRSASTLSSTPFVLETAGSVTFQRLPTGLYQLVDGVTTLSMTLNSAAVAWTSAEGWLAIAGDRNTSGGYDVLWKNYSGGFVGWHVSAGGVFQSGFAVTDVRSVETFFGIDVNGDSSIGHIVTTIESVGSVSLRSSTEGTYTLLDGPTQIGLSLNGTVVGPNPASSWTPIHAEDNGSGGYDVLWRSGSGGYVGWHVSSTGVFQSGFAVPDVRTVETFFGSDINGDGTVGIVATTIESVGSVGLQSSTANVYTLIDGSSQIGLSYGGSPVGPNPSSGWSAIHAASNGSGGYDVLWRNGAGAYVGWHVSSTGAFQSGFAVPDVRGVESVFGADINGDGTIGHVITTLESAGSVSLRSSSDGTYTLLDGSTSLGLTYGGSPVGPNPSSGWSAIQAEDNGSGGYDVLWRNGAGAYVGWHVSGTGAFQSGFAVPDVRGVESFFAADVNGDGTIGHVITTLESAGSVSLRSSTAGAYTLLDGSTQIGLTFNGAVVGPDPSSGWSPVQAEDNGSGGYDVLWRNGAGAYVGWHVSGTGAFQSGFAVADVRAVESFFAADVNGDGTIGHVITTIESAGSVSLRSSTDGTYTLLDGSTPVGLTYLGSVVGPNPASGWSAIHAEDNTSGGYDVLWRNVSGGYVGWHVSSTGAFQSGFAVPDVRAVESFFGADINGDSHLGGQPLQSRAGDVRLFGSLDSLGSILEQDSGSLGTGSAIGSQPRDQDYDTAVFDDPAGRAIDSLLSQLASDRLTG